MKHDKCFEICQTLIGPYSDFEKLFLSQKWTYEAEIKAGIPFDTIFLKKKCPSTMGKFCWPPGQLFVTLRVRTRSPTRKNCTFLPLFWGPDQVSA